MTTSTSSIPHGIRYADGDGDVLTVEAITRGYVNIAAHEREHGETAEVSLDMSQARVLRDQLTSVLDEDAGQTFAARVGHVACPGCTGDPDEHPGDPVTITSEAESLQYGDREDDYGHPRDNLTRTAVLWTGLVQHKLADGEYLEPEDVARLHLAGKLSRDVHQPKRDNRVDMAGYALALDRLATGS